MNITTNTELSQRYPCFARELDDIEEIVIHGTGGGVNAIGMLKWMLSPGGRIEEYKRSVGLFHFLIDRGGEIIQLYDITRWMYHSSSGAHDKATIGIEMINPSTNNATEYSSEQYTALVYLIANITKTAKIKTIVGHGYNKKKFTGGFKNCPGRFDWVSLVELLNVRGLDYNMIDPEALHVADTHRSL